MQKKYIHWSVQSSENTVHSKSLRVPVERVEPFAATTVKMCHSCAAPEKKMTCFLTNYGQKVCTYTQLRGHGLVLLSVSVMKPLTKRD